MDVSALRIFAILCGFHGSRADYSVALLIFRKLRGFLDDCADYSKVVRISNLDINQLCEHIKRRIVEIPTISTTPSSFISYDILFSVENNPHNFRKIRTAAE